MKRMRGLAIAGTLGACLIVPATSHGAITIGSNLATAPAFGDNCIGTAGCTQVFDTLTPAARAPGGVHTTVNGVITSWRVRAGANVGPVSLRVARFLNNNLFTGVGTSAPAFPAVQANTTSPFFQTQLPISIGDRIGINCCSNGQGDYIAAQFDSTYLLFQPALPDGGQEPGAPVNFSELALQAVIEPTSAFEIGKVKKLAKGKLRVTATLPNAGTLVAGDRRDPKTGASAAAKKPRYIKRKTTQVNAAGKVTFKLKATKAARQALKTKARLKAKLRLAFTPTGGTTAVETKKTKLKRKKK